MGINVSHFFDWSKDCSFNTFLLLDLVRIQKLCIIPEVRFQVHPLILMTCNVVKGGIQHSGKYSRIFWSSWKHFTAYLDRQRSSIGLAVIKAVMLLCFHLYLGLCRFSQHWLRHSWKSVHSSRPRNHTFGFWWFVQIAQTVSSLAQKSKKPKRKKSSRMF